MQLPALHGHRLPRLPYAHGVSEIPHFHGAHRVVAGICRGHRARLVSAASLDLHAIHLLEPLALHGAKFRVADDVRAPCGPRAESRRKKRNSSVVHGIVSLVDTEFSDRTLGRRTDSFAQPASKSHRSRASRAGTIVRRSKWLGAGFHGAARPLRSDPRAADAGRHAVPVVPVARHDPTFQRARGPANALQQRRSGRAAFRAISLDHQLLSATRSAPARGCPLEVFTVPFDPGRGRNRVVHSWTVDREPHVSPRFRRQLPDLHSAGEHPSLHSRRGTLETARFTRCGILAQ